MGAPNPLFQRVFLGREHFGTRPSQSPSFSGCTCSLYTPTSPHTKYELLIIRCWIFWNLRGRVDRKVQACSQAKARLAMSRIGSPSEHWCDKRACNFVQKISGLQNATGKRPRQKPSKIVTWCHNKFRHFRAGPNPSKFVKNWFRHFSTMFARPFGGLWEKPGCPQSFWLQNFGSPLEDVENCSRSVEQPQIWHLSGLWQLQFMDIWAYLRSSFKGPDVAKRGPRTDQRTVMYRCSRNDCRINNWIRFEPKICICNGNNDPGALKVTDLRWQRTPKTQIFAENRRFSQIHPFSWKFQHLPFGGRRKPQKTAGFRRKPKIFAENRRKPLIGLRHLRCVTFSSAPNERSRETLYL